MELLDTLLAKLGPLLGTEQSRSILRALAILVVGIPLARLLSRGGAVLARQAFGAPRAKVLQGFTWYALVFAVVVSALREVGFDLSVLLGAAGVLTVALGFASQTSASNVISGLFLVAERPFELGDQVEIEGTTGVVLSIDLLSVKLRTFDNQFVRLPNETLVKARIVNLTRYPIRRADLLVSVAYDSDLDRVEAVLRQLAASEPLLLDEPRPFFSVVAFAASGIDVRFGAWATRETYYEAKVVLYKRALEAFRREGIEIPFPQQVVIHKGEGIIPAGG